MLFFFSMQEIKAILADYARLPSFRPHISLVSLPSGLKSNMLPPFEGGRSNNCRISHS